ncbi:MAG TPA: hypothetical protein VFM70_06660 [Salinimicrobium sp.]|nr:hypothetical protein [Salinimicrobium sp.]
MKRSAAFLVSLFLISCAAHQRSHIKANEEFVIELKKPSTRGGVAEIALQGLFFGANYLAEKSTKALTSSYSQSLSVNDYYNTDLGYVEKTYNEIHIKKYANPEDPEIEEQLRDTITREIKSLPKTRGTKTTSLSLENAFREEKNDLLSFHAVIELISDPENPGVTRLSFNELYIFFSRTKVFSDEDLNARFSVSIEGQWRNTDGTPMKDTLIEQEYEFRNLKYGPENQIDTPILSPWYVDIPIAKELEEGLKYGVVQVNVQLEEYEGNRSKYINQLPSILSDNKNTIIKDGAATIQKITD